MSTTQDTRQSLIQSVLAGKPIPDDELAQHDDLKAFQDLRNLLADEVRKSAYGCCPMCGAAGVMRERRPDGNDHCANGHVYPSRLATTCPTNSTSNPTPSSECPFCGETTVEPIDDKLVCRHEDCVMEGVPFRAPSPVKLDQREDDLIPSADTIIDRGLPVGLELSAQIRQRVLDMVKKKRAEMGLAETE